MSAAFEELDYRPTPMGDLILRRRQMAALDNREVYEVILGDSFLMSDLFTVVEEELSRLSLAACDGKEKMLDVVVGGLGLGYTAKVALEDPRVRSLLVVEAMEGVIDWHRRGLVPLGEGLTNDPRCRYIHGDFFALAANPDQGFDLEEPGRKFHAVLLDIDHSPKHLLIPSNASFYTVEGLQNLKSQLHEGGVFGLWSDDPPDEDFLKSLGEVFDDCRSEVVTFENHLQGGESESTVYVAR